MSRRYYWLKLREDFFRDKTMKKMRRIAGGDTYVIIYLKMMLMSIQTGGELYFEGIENDFASEIALVLDEDEENVRVAIGFLLRSGKLIEKSKSIYFLQEASEAIGSESGSAERVRKFREKQRQERLENENQKTLTCEEKCLPTLQCNEEETPCNVAGNVEKSREEKSRVDKSRVDKMESTGAQSDKPTDTPPPKAKRFVKPTMEDIRVYCQSRQNSVDPERFWNYYESNGWRVGKSPMKDWKAAVRNWELNERNRGESHGSNTGSVADSHWETEF